MKKIKALYVGMAMTAVLSMTSCQADMDAPELVEPKATMEANTTISDFKTAFADQTVLCPMKDEATQTPYIIKGRVISSDATGNIYKSIVIQDETAALALSINQGSTYTDYRLGQEVVLNATGLYIGYYNGLQQIGWLDEYNGSPSLTFMSWSMFQAHSELNGFPNQDVKYVFYNKEKKDPWPSENPYCVVTNFSDLPSDYTSAEFRNMQSQLVEFRNVYFEEGGKETYAPYQESVNRTLMDGTGASLTVRTSGYSNFYNEIIPEGTGTVRGILSYYGDSWQLLLRGLDDVMITDKGQKNDPYTVAEAMEVQNEGLTGWVTAYIVGSVKAGVNTVSSNNDVIFGKDAEMDNNILIAASDNETDWSKCIAVELPQGSAFRASVNLVDNPGVLGKAILVNGSLSTFLGMPGIKDNGGTASDVEVDGVTISGGGGDEPGPGEGIPNGDGTEAKPYSASQVSAMTTATGTNLYTNVWATGYIVGYVDTGIKSYATDESAKFTVPAAVATNLLLANSPDEKDWNKCMSVNLPSGSDARSKLNLKDNTGNLGKLLTIKGTITRYVGISGLKEPSDFRLGEGGGDTPNPPATGSTIYEGLTLNANDWDMNNAQAPTGIKVWQWDSKNTCLKGAAFANSKPNAADVTCISPVFSIPVSGAELDFQYVFNQYKKNNEMINVADFSGYAYILIREEGSSSWTDLAEMKAQGFAWTPWYDAKYSLNNYSGKNIQIGFRYVSTDEVAGTWEIKNLKVTGSK